MRSTSSLSRKTIVVAPTSPNNTPATWPACVTATVTAPSGKVFPCAVGRAGIGVKIREGDGVTPIGVWPIRRVLYRSDTIAEPRTALRTVAIQPDDGWVDDPSDPHYNQQVKIPYAASHELLWRADDRYNLVVVLGFNDRPVLPGLGSAIFMHIATPEYAPTAGCVALSLDDLRTLLSECPEDAQVEIVPRHADV